MLPMDALKLKRGDWYLLERVLSVSTWNQALRETHLVQILSHEEDGFYRARMIDTGEEVRLKPFFQKTAGGSPSWSMMAKATQDGGKAYKHYTRCLLQTEKEVEVYVKSNNLKLEPEAAQTFRERVTAWIRDRKFW